MKIGFVGVGTIATAVIEGIFKAKIKIGQIIVSPKNYKNAKLLQKKFKKIKIAKSNQEVLDKSDWIFLAVTPKIGKKILNDLKFNKKHTIINFISTIHNHELRKIISPASKIFKIAPLPMIKHNLGPIIIYPKNNDVEKFFKKLGNVISTNNENMSKKLWVMTSFMATYFKIFNTAHEWLIKKGINKKISKDYLNNLFAALVFENYKNKNSGTSKMLAEFQTKAGINEEFINRAKKARIFKNLNKGFDKIYNRIK